MLGDNALALDLLKSLYVDDFVSGAKDVNNAFSLSKEIKLCPKSGSFNMMKWNSNSASLLKSLEQDSAFIGDFATVSGECVQEEAESFSKSVFKQSTEKEQKVLGMLWNHTLNKTFEGMEAQLATRRLIFSTATGFFDPLGLISPVILPYKIMFQKLCYAQTDWDELVNTELSQEWLSTLSDLRQAERVSFK